MNLAKNIFNLFEWVIMTFWGITFIELVPLIGFEFDFLTGIDATIKTLFALVGLIFLVITLPIRVKNEKLKKRIAEEELEKLEWENSKHEKENIVTVFKPKKNETNKELL